MVKYIDTEAVKRAVVEAVDNGLASTSADLAEIIDDLPAADVEPVRHGWWETHLLPLAVKCSCCGHKASFREWKSQHLNFCPHCGAKMDGGDAGGAQGH